MTSIQECQWGGDYTKHQLLCAKTHDRLPLAVRVLIFLYHLNLSGLMPRQAAVSIGQTPYQSALRSTGTNLASGGHFDAMPPAETASKPLSGPF